MMGAAACVYFLTLRSATKTGVLERCRNAVEAAMLYCGISSEQFRRNCRRELSMNSILTFRVTLSNAHLSLSYN